MAYLHLGSVVAGYVAIAALPRVGLFSATLPAVKRRQIAERMTITELLPDERVIARPANRANLIYRVVRRGKAISRVDQYDRPRVRKVYFYLNFAVKCLRDDPANCPKTLVVCSSIGLMEQHEAYLARELSPGEDVGFDTSDDGVVNNLPFASIDSTVCDPERDRVLALFESGHIKVLLITKMGGHGIDYRRIEYLFSVGNAGVCVCVCVCV